MVIDDVFPNPTVKQVIFQARFQSLFFIQNLIGEYQRLIMARFPVAKAMVRSHTVIVEGVREKITALLRDQDTQQEEPSVERFWHFETENGIELNVATSSFDVMSPVHKTYDNPKSEDRFRDLLESTLGAFVRLTNVQRFTRLGLRYIDECPVTAATTSTFCEWYDTALPVGRFSIEDSVGLQLTAQVNRGGQGLIYKEVYKLVSGKPTLTLDFDGFALGVPAGDFLNATDLLHKIIAEEYGRSIKAPLVEHMKRPKEGA